MKKLLSFLAVAAIVISAFAFTTKSMVATFCVRNAAGNACEVIHNKKMVEEPPNFKHFPLGPGQWDGTFAGCINASPVTDCIVYIHLIPN